MKLVDMLATFLNREEQNEKLREIAYNKLPMMFQVSLAQHGIDPSSFAGGINFILQLFQAYGLPDDWDELTKPIPPDLAKVSGVKLKEEDGPALASEVEEFMMAWMKFKRGPGPLSPNSESSGLC